MSTNAAVEVPAIVEAFPALLGPDGQIVDWFDPEPAEIDLAGTERSTAWNARLAVKLQAARERLSEKEPEKS